MSCNIHYTEKEILKTRLLKCFVGNLKVYYVRKYQYFIIWLTVRYLPIGNGGRKDLIQKLCLLRPQHVLGKYYRSPLFLACPRRPSFIINKHSRKMTSKGDRKLQIPIESKLFMFTTTTQVGSSINLDVKLS
jgi:hypothetical protein